MTPQEDGPITSNREFFVFIMVWVMLFAAIACVGNMEAQRQRHWGEIVEHDMGNGVVCWGPRDLYYLSCVYVPEGAMMSLAKPSRPQWVLSRQMRDLETYYRSRAAQVGDDTPMQRAEAASYGGWYIPIGTGQAKRTEARHAGYVHAAVDQQDVDPRSGHPYPLHLRLYAMQALGLIALDEATCIQLELIHSLTQSEVAKELRVSVRTVQRNKLRGLEAVALILWDPTGHQTVPEELR